MRTLAAVGLPLGLLARRRAFARLFGARGLTSLSAGAYRLALAWLILVRTGSPLALGGMAVAMALASILAPWLGALVDRLPRRALLVATDAGSALACLALAGLGAGPHLAILPAYVLVFVVSSLGMLDWTALNAAIPQAVLEGELAEANGLWSAGMNVIGLAAPALAGLALAAVGPVVTLSIVALGYAVAAATVSGVRVAPVRTPGPQTGVWQAVREGVRFVLGDAVLTRLTLISAGLNLAYSSTAPMVILLLQRRMGLHPAAIGIVFAAEAAGTLAASALFARFGRRLERGAGIMAAGALLALGLGIWAAAGALVLAIAAAALVGFAVGTGNLHMLTLRQEIVPPALLGRTLGTTAMLGRLVMSVAPAAGAALAAGAGLVLLFAASGGVALAVAAGLGPGLRAAARRARRQAVAPAG